MSKTIRSDERLLDILESLKRDGEAGVTDLADRLEMSKSTVHAHLATLRDRGYVVRTDDATYRIGLRFLDFGTAAREARNVHEAARPTLEALADETGENVWCVVEERGDAVFLARAAGERALETDAHVGQHVALYRLAAGKAILANLPESRRTTILDGYEYPLDGTELDREALEAELAAIRERGYARSADRFVKSVSGIGAPIVDNEGVVHGALSVSCPTKRLSTTDAEADLADRLQRAVNELGVNLTYW